jgi:YidC/Oxa1 family membrane protein insertase
MMANIGSSIGAIFHPIYHFFGWLLAFFYSIIPNYAVAISLLTVVIMAVLTPFTVKSTKSMVAMQKLQPEIKKLQAKYKGPENRQLLNEEVMRLYKESGTNPLSSCFPVLAQAPFLFVLYQTIRGLAFKTAAGLSEPKYIPSSSKMYHAIQHAHGKIEVLGFDMSLKPIGHHGTWVHYIPYFALVLLAVGLQYFQMAQINNRNKKTGGPQAPDAQQRLQKFFPILFAYFYVVIPAAVCLYMVVSTIIRILTQDIMFRTGVSNPTSARNASRGLPAGKDDESKANGEEQTPKPQQHPRSKSKRQRKER